MILGRRTVIAGIAVALGVTFALPSAGATGTLAAGSSAACPGSQSGCIQAMLNIINSDRAQAGRPPLSLNLTQSNGTGACVGSYGHSTAMAQSGAIWHTNSKYPQASFPKNICVPFQAAGENVGMARYGNELTDLQRLDAMMMSEPHSAATCASTINHACNILSSRFHQIGIGIYYVNGTTWLTEDFTN